MQNRTHSIVQSFTNILLIIIFKVTCCDCFMPTFSSVTGIYPRITSDMLAAKFDVLLL